MDENKDINKEEASTPVKEDAASGACADSAEEEASPKTKKEEKSSKKELAKLQKEFDALKKENDKLKNELEKQKETESAQNERYLRMMAEYDNFRKRTAAEKDALYTGALTDVFKEILPVVDALEMAVRYDDGTDTEKIKKGVEMTLQKFKDTLEKLGVSEIETTVFDPNFHNAVMHVEDESKGEGEILEVFQKGYKKGDKIIRYAMVKVAN